MNRAGPSQGTSSMTTGPLHESGVTHPPMALQSQGPTISPGVPSPGGAGIVVGPQQTSTSGYSQPPPTKVTRPSIAIQGNADHLLQLVKDERAKIEKTYQDSLHRLETQFEDHKRRVNQEREDNKRRDKSLGEEIARLKAEVDKLQEENTEMVRALGRVGLEFINGGVKSKQPSTAGDSNNK